MGKTEERMNGLSNILDNVSESHVSIDDIPVEIKKGPGRPKKEKTKFYMYCGMEVPDKIYNICMYLEELLKDQNKYSPALGAQIFNAAVQQWLYNDLIKNKITGKEPVLTRQLTTASESYRRALQSLGLTVTDKNQGVSKDDTAHDPTKEFIDAVNDTGKNDEIISKKPKRKKQ